MGEFELIRQFFMRPARTVLLGNGDDCALIEPRPGKVLAVSTDMLVAGRHFFADVAPHALGYKALAVNLSDLAAMAAAPRAFTLALALPQAEPGWLGEFARGLFQCAEQFGCELIGGDTTRGPLTISITVFGDVEVHYAPRRSGGRIGDDIWISGALGEAAYALVLEQQRRAGVAIDEIVWRALMPRLEYPEPRLALGQALGPVVHAMLDISDGLVGDLGHIVEASGCGAVIDERLIPVASEIEILDLPMRRRLVLGGGDDYELCFTAPVQQRDAIPALARQLGAQAARIGALVDGCGVEVIGCTGQLLTCAERDDVSGFDHFG